MVSVSVQWIIGIVISIFMILICFLLRDFFIKISNTFNDIKLELGKINEKLTSQNTLVIELKHEKQSLAEKITSLATRLFTLEEDLKENQRNYLESWNFISKHLDQLRKKIDP